MKLEDLKQLANKGLITQCGIVDYYLNHKQELSELTVDTLKQMGVITVETPSFDFDCVEEVVEPVMPVEDTTTEAPVEVKTTKVKEPVTEAPVEVKDTEDVTTEAPADDATTVAPVEIVVDEGE